jgi:hypothetical protein
VFEGRSWPFRGGRYFDGSLWTTRFEKGVFKEGRGLFEVESALKEGRGLFGVERALKDGCGLFEVEWILMEVHRLHELKKGF